MLTRISLTILFIAALFSAPSSSFAANCVIVGDSIAVRLGRISPECYTSAGDDLRSVQAARLVPPGTLLVVISVGSNDPRNLKLERNLRAARARATNFVVWVLPANPRARRIVERVAAENNDFTVGFVPAKDGVHPKSYRAIKRKIEKWAFQMMRSRGFAAR